MRLGQWGDMVRSVAGHDYDRAQAVLRWPLREALIAYAEILRADAREAYKHSMLLWNISAPWSDGSSKPPKLPDILKDEI